MSRKRYTPSSAIPTPATGRPGISSTGRCGKSGRGHGDDGPKRPEFGGNAAGSAVVGAMAGKVIAKSMELRRCKTVEPLTD